ncbi:MAG: hypothetical protein R2681_03180 [Pyrinomonadaceae bacterium]
MSYFDKNACPACGHNKRKNYLDLEPDELLLVKKLPRNADFSDSQRKSHQFCARCWHEFVRGEELGGDHRA